MLRWLEVGRGWGLPESEGGCGAFPQTDTTPTPCCPHPSTPYNVIEVSPRVIPAEWAGDLGGGFHLRHFGWASFPSFLFSPTVRALLGKKTPILALRVRVGGGVSGMILGSLMIQGGCGKGRSRAAGGLRSRSSHTWTSWCSPKFKSALMSADPQTPQACSSQCWDKLVSVWFSYMCPEWTNKRHSFFNTSLNKVIVSNNHEIWIIIIMTVWEKKYSGRVYYWTLYIQSYQWKWMKK